MAEDPNSTAPKPPAKSSFFGRVWNTLKRFDKRETSKRRTAWFISGAAISAWIMLREISNILGSITEGTGSRSFNTTVLHGFSLLPWENVPDVRSALELWSRLGIGQLRILLLTYALLDLLVILGYAYWLRRAFATHRTEGTGVQPGFVLIPVVFDLIENTATLALIPLLNRAESGLLTAAIVIMRFSSTAKWLALAVLVAVAATGWRAARKRRSADVDAGTGIDHKEESAQSATIAQAAIVAIYLALIAVPVGGPLAQIPDLLRYQIGDPGWPMFWSAASVAAFAAIIAASAIYGARARVVEEVPTEGQGSLTWKATTETTVAGLQLPVAASVWTLLLLALGLFYDGSFNQAGLAPAIVVWVLWVVHWFSSRLNQGRGWRDLVRGAWRGWKEIASLLRGRLSAFVRQTFRQDQPTGIALHVLAGPEPQKEKRCFIGWDDDLFRWAGFLAGAVVVGSGVGMIRAASPALLLRPSDETADATWLLWTLVGVTAAIFGGFLTQRIIERFGKRLVSQEGHGQISIKPSLHNTVRVALWGSIIVCMVLAERPELAPRLSATGTAIIAFSGYAAFAAMLQSLRRRWLQWDVAAKLGFLGQRTPWFSLLLLTFALASVLNTNGSYHDIRTQVVEADQVKGHSSLAQALAAWDDMQDREACPVLDAAGNVDPDAKRPLVMVAAPGGGIRAAYWTTNALEALFPDECARNRLFAISGASGGSVGATVWRAAIVADPTGAVDEDGLTGAKAAISAISGDEAIATTIAGLLLRDLPQPLIGLTTAWRDRAALLEDSWISRSAVLGDEGNPLPWQALNGEGWSPVMVLNSASVSDGCRILVTNVAGLTASSSSDCLEQDADGGPIGAAIDGLANLTNQSGADSCGHVEVGAVTAALLSARFPYVTPSGAIRRCVTAPQPAVEADPESDVIMTAPPEPGDAPEIVVSYAVDGGYYENSGILALLEMIDKMEPELERRNIEPWLIVADNHYRGTTATATADRPLELFVPIIAFAGNDRILSQAALEQSASITLRDSAAPSNVENDQPDTEACTRFVLIAPKDGPGVAAPLGWALSNPSRSSLDNSLTDAVLGASPPMDHDDLSPQQRCVAPLWETLHIDRSG